MIKVDVIVHTMCSDVWSATHVLLLYIQCRSFCGHRCWMLYEMWNRAITTYNWNSFKKFICHQPYFEWYPGILFYKWFGNQTRNRLLKYYNTMTRNYVFRNYSSNRQKFNRLQPKPTVAPTVVHRQKIEPSTRGKSWPEKWLNSSAVLWLSVIFGGIANLSFIFILKCVN